MLVPSSIAHYRHGRRDRGASSRRPGTMRCTPSTAATVAGHGLGSTANNLTRMTAISIHDTIPRRCHSGGEHLAGTLARPSTTCDDRLRPKIRVQDPGPILWSPNLVIRAFARRVPRQLTASWCAAATFDAPQLLVTRRSADSTGSRVSDIESGAMRPVFPLSSSLRTVGMH
jgi:hypothetical protein